MIDSRANETLPCLFCCPTIYQPSCSIILLLHRLRPVVYDGQMAYEGTRLSLWTWKTMGTLPLSCFTPLALREKNIKPQSFKFRQNPIRSLTEPPERVCCPFFLKSGCLDFTKKSKTNRESTHHVNRQRNGNKMRMHWKTCAICQSIGFNFCGHSLGFSMRLIKLRFCTKTCCETHFMVYYNGSQVIKSCSCVSNVYI